MVSLAVPLGPTLPSPFWVLSQLEGSARLVAQLPMAIVPHNGHVHMLVAA